MPRAKKAANSRTAAAEAPNVVLDYQTLEARYRVIVNHAPGIDYFVTVERFDEEKQKWVSKPAGLKKLFDPVHCAMEVAIIQLADRLVQAEATIASLQTQSKD